MKTYEPKDLGDCLVMTEAEGGGWCKAEDVARLAASLSLLVKAVKNYGEANDMTYSDDPTDERWEKICRGNKELNGAFAEAETLIK